MFHINAMSHIVKPFYQAPKEEGKKKKKGGGKTVSSVYLVSLMELMAQVGGECLCFDV